jgi:hypothetical protein
MGWLLVSDLRWGRRPKLHGMQAFMPDSGLMDEHGADSLALVDATGDGEDEEVAAERPGVLGALIRHWDNI